MTKEALDSLDGAPVLGVIYSVIDVERQYAFQARALWDGTHLSLAPLPSGPLVTVPFDSDRHPPVVELTVQARAVLLEGSEQVDVITRLTEGARFAVFFQSDSVPSGATHVPGLVALAIVPNWPR